MQNPHNIIREIDKMKTIYSLGILIVLTFGACSTSRTIYDDVYFSRKVTDHQDAQIATAAQAQQQPTTRSSNSDYEYQNYYQENISGQAQDTETQAVYSTTETIVEPDGTTYSSTETYYDSEYAQRIRRFNSGSTSSFGYYDGYYTGCFDCSRNYFSMSYGYPYGMGMSMGFGYPYYNSYWSYYDPFFYDSWYNPWYSYRNPWRYNYWGYGSYWSGYRYGYMHGFWDGYYYGDYYDYPYYSKMPGNYLYGHRSSIGGSSTVPQGAPRGSRSDQKQGASIGTGRAINDGTSSVAPATARGSVRAGDANTSQPQTQAVNRAPRPDASQRQAAQATTQEKLNEYRQRYNRPGTPAARTQQYERPRTYTSPSVRQPKSSNEYVRPQSETRSSTGTSARTVRESNRAPAQGSSGTVRSQTPVRSSGTTSPSRSYSQPSRSSTPAYSPSRSSSSYQSSGTSSSSGSSRGSSSSSSSGRRR